MGEARSRYPRKRPQWVESGHWRGASVSARNLFHSADGCEVTGICLANPLGCALAVEVAAVQEAGTLSLDLRLRHTELVSIAAGQVPPQLGELLTDRSAGVEPVALAGERAWMIEISKHRQRELAELVPPPPFHCSPLVRFKVCAA